jgi:hypothetical protein
MFSDIQNHWAKEYIVQLGERSLIKGYSDGTFRPAAPLTRAEFASLMVGAFGNSPEVQKAVTFKDVPKSNWAWQFIQTVSKKRFFSGYPDGTFRPEQPILRVEAISVIASALNLPIPKLPELTLKDAFDDAVMIPKYARNVIASATQMAIVVNYPNVRKLRPNQNASRGEVAALLCRALRIYQTVYIVTYEYVAVSIAGTETPRRIFGSTPETIESYFGIPIYWPIDYALNLSTGYYAASTAIRHLCSPIPKNINFYVDFENSKAMRIIFDPVGDKHTRIKVDIKQVFEYIFGYPFPMGKDLSKASDQDFPEGFRRYTYCLGDGILVSWDDSSLFGTNNVQFSYDSTC